jgi:hypothetical protein
MSDQKTSLSASPPSHASVFIWLFAVSAIWHYTSSSSDIINYWFTYNPKVTPLVFLSIGSAFIAACYPTRTWALMTMCVGQLIAIFLRFPFVADHLVMELFLNFAILISFLSVAIPKRTLKVSVEELFAIFSPIGRWLLIIMYFYGTFHKFNPGFMSIHSSCAVPFIEGFPVVRDMLGAGVLEYAAIYGTLILESIAMFLLLSSRTKYFGMLMGMSFHFIIGISGYGTLAHFSAFALALHTLFVPSGFGKRIFNERLVPDVLKSEINFRVATVLFITLQVALAIHLATSRQGYLVNSLFALFAVTVMFLVFKHGQVRQGDAPYRLKSPLLALNVLPVWFFIYCLSPYIGMGTGGVMAMFSGLHTEGGVSNHYIIREPIRLFPYQDTVVYFESATNPSLAKLAEEGQGVVMFDFQRHITYREQLALPLTVRVNGQRYPLENPDQLIQFMNEYFTDQSWLERKYMSFRVVDDPAPKQCRH